MSDFFLRKCTSQYCLQQGLRNCWECIHWNFFVFLTLLLTSSYIKQIQDEERSSVSSFTDYQPLTITSETIAEHGTICWHLKCWNNTLAWLSTNLDTLEPRRVTLDCTACAWLCALETSLGASTFFFLNDVDISYGTSLLAGQVSSQVKRWPDSYHVNIRLRFNWPSRFSVESRYCNIVFDPISVHVRQIASHCWRFGHISAT